MGCCQSSIDSDERMAEAPRARRGLRETPVPMTAQERLLNLMRTRRGQREEEERFEHHGSHRHTVSSEYLFGVKNPFAKFVKENNKEDEDEAIDDDEVERMRRRTSSQRRREEEEEEGMRREESFETVGSEESVPDLQKKPLLKESMRSTAAAAVKVSASEEKTFMQRSFGRNKHHRRTESEPPPTIKVTERRASSPLQGIIFGGSAREGGSQKEGGHQRRLSRLVSKTKTELGADDSYKAMTDEDVYEKNDDDMSSNTMREIEKSIVRRNNSETTTSAAKHFRSLSVSHAAETKTTNIIESESKGDLRASIFEALEQTRSTTPFDDSLCCPTCFDEYNDENPKITLPCAHHFHLSCICEWNERGHSECPTCMTDVGYFDE